jgi:thiol-disulfide isomerase/thioredoxin
MSQDIESNQQFRAALGSYERVCALFYASWCPYSRRFLPEFDRVARRNENEFSSVKVDDLNDLCDEYDVNVYPTVIFFERGNILARLDGVLGTGLAGSQLSGLIEKCTPTKKEK